MNIYLLVVHDSEKAPVKFSRLRGTAKESNAFSPFMDTWLFHSSLSLDEVKDALNVEIRREEDLDQPPWLVVQVSGGGFGGRHSPGPSSRLSSFFPS